jgi:hypothetical protein
MGIWGDEPKRKHVRKSDREHLLDYQKGKCGRCKQSFKRKGVRPKVHHKNLNPKDNRIVNLVLVCPDCHDKIHQKEKKVRKVVSDGWGGTEIRVVKVKPKKTVKKKAKPTTKKKKKLPRKKIAKKTTTKKKTTKRKTTKKATRKKTVKKKTSKKKAVRKKTTKKTTKRKTTKRKTTKKKTTKRKTTKRRKK